MLRGSERIQLLVFVVIAAVTLTYGLVRFAGIEDAVSPPYTVTAEFASSGGIYPRAQVTQLGVRVGTVTALRPRPDGSVLVDLEIDNGVEIPSELAASIASTSAVGELRVELTPLRQQAPPLRDGSRIDRSRTSVPLPVEDLLSDLNSLAASLPEDDLTVTLTEAGRAFSGSGPRLRRLLERSNELTATSLRNLDDAIDLIGTGSRVLDTQLEHANDTETIATELAGLSDEMRALNSDVATVFTEGLRAGEQVSGLLRDTRHSLPLLLRNLLTVTDVTVPRLPGVRKSLAILPRAIEGGLSAVRPCDKYDMETGEPILSTCDIDPRTGEFVWSGRLAAQLDLPNMPGQVCVSGYEGTKKYLPSGLPADGQGPPQPPNSPPNLEAHCAAPPTDPRTPNVRGSQNAQRPAEESTVATGGRGSAGSTSRPVGLVVDERGALREVLEPIGPRPPAGADPLAWLLVRSVEEEVR